MYGLIGIFIITVMIGTLAVASSMGLPDSDLLVSMSSFSLLPLLLIIVAILLIVISQRGASPPVATHSSFSKSRLSVLRLSFRAFHYLLIALLTSILIIGSAWQVLSHHQQAETTKITEPMRVQAWVTIEGISDSVYDPETNNGYRQVAILRALTPLVAELSDEDLNANTLEYIKNNSSDNDNTKNIKGTKYKTYRILLNAYPKNNKADTKLAALNGLQPGAQLLMTLALAPLETSQEALNNPSGFDSYRWLRARDIDGVANVIAMGAPVNVVGGSSTLPTFSDSYLHPLRVTIDQWRWQLRQHFYQDWPQKTTAQQQARAVTLSLLTGDRSLISHETKDLYQLAGISHLLAISGTHVLFSAIMLAGLVTLLIDKRGSALYRTIPRWQVRWWVMIGAAFIYALFTGFDVPAARTAWMLLAVGAVRLTLLPISTMRVLLALAIVMAWFDPYVLWQAGYWLSFIAVALLLNYDDGRQAQAKLSAQHQRKHNLNRQHSRTDLMRTKIWSLFKRVFKLQCWLFIALLPITLLLFGKVSLWGLVINLFAIGLFGWVIVPLNLLAGLCYLIFPIAADSIWTLVSAVVANLHELIAWLTGLPALKGAWLYTPVNTGMLLMALLIMLPWLLPRGLISRWLALPPLALLMMTVSSNQQALSLAPTLYILPTGDRYVTAAVLQYPINNNKINKDKLNEDNQLEKSSVSGNVSWLFLANHRPHDMRTMPSSLNADKLSETLEQQLRTLAIKHLEGIVVQTSVTALTSPLTNILPNKKPKEKNIASSPELLPMTVAQLIQSLPTNHYWQAGRSERWSTLQQTYLNDSSSETRTLISAQRCEQGKIWQLANGDLTLQAMTGWHKIDDASVWDCTLAIDSDMPINIVRYNGVNPRQSPNLTVQKLALSTAPPEENLDQALEQSVVKNKQNADQNLNQSKRSQSRLILDAATHPRIWQLWSLLCTAEPFAISNASEHSITWLSHSSSPVSAEILMTQRVGEVMTYDNEPLEVALSLGTESQVD
ncbi:ComEC/Rec2 family competence protein [Psychrobacter frigidicola]|uniref:ComEC/Rec2 family competence protein n=1 Tax=Psychrobacter frigidicola TaxID=45611 RepID=UPI001D12E175|nr:ComEC/Rec2 family competence protein [Psychrobacter frigidicola]